AAAPRARERLVDAIAEQIAVRQIGEQVVLREVLDLLLRALRLGDVARDREDARRLPGREAQRSGVRLHPAALAAQAGDLEFDGAALPAQRAIQAFDEELAVLRQQEVEQAVLARLFQGLGFEHDQPRAVYFEQGAVRGGDRHAFGLA